MKYWIKRIILKTGELVTERELSQDENIFEGAVPVVGEKLFVSYRGRSFEAEVMWGNWPNSPARDPDLVVPLRVREI
jgi:hypothetical protein